MRAARPLLAVLAMGLGVVGAAPAAWAQTEASDPGRSRQWGLERIGGAAAWSVAMGRGITIAIVDSGVSPTHPDLVEQLEPLVDCSGGEACRTGPGVGLDDAGHGTHVAGIAAATAGNGEGVAGVAPDARILSVKALARSCAADDDCAATGTSSDVVNAIRYAVDHGADIINLSLGSTSAAGALVEDVLGPQFLDALHYAWDNGAIPVLAAGNQADSLGSLADVPAVIVAATISNDEAADYSDVPGNVRWAVAAPGGERDDGDSCASESPRGILSTYFDPAATGTEDPNAYACIAGTSMAAPHVAGALAVLRSAGLTPQETVDRLLATADDLGPRGRDAQYGSGRINLASAVAGLEATGGGPPAVIDDPSTSTTLTATTVPAPAAPTAPPPTTPDPTSPDTAAPDTTTVAPVQPGVTTPPVTFDAAAPGVDLPGPADSLPALPLTLAVLAVVGTAGAHAWRYLAAASWAQRTPDR